MKEAQNRHWPGRFFVDIRLHFGYSLKESRSVKDAFGRGYSRMRSECGTRGRNDTLRSRAALGNYARPALRPVCEITLAGLGQEGAGNTRLAAHDLTGKPVTTFPDHALKRARGFSNPVVRSFRIAASDQVPGSAYLELSCGVRSLQQEPWWNADRRACPLAGSPSRKRDGVPYSPQAGEGKETRACAVPPPASSPARGGG